MKMTPSYAKIPFSIYVLFDFLLYRREKRRPVKSVFMRVSTFCLFPLYKVSVSTAMSLSIDSNQK